MSLGAEPTTDRVSPPDPGSLACRILYREAGGTVHRDWPVGRLSEVLADGQGTVWLDIHHAGEGEDAPLERFLRETFGFHPLAIDDALCESHVPKLDDWGAYLYSVFHDVTFDAEAAQLRTREIDIFLGPNYLVTFHTEPIALLDRLPETFEREAARLPANPGADHLLYVLMDEGIADYLKAVDRIDGLIEDAQDEVLADPSARTLSRIFEIKRSVLQLYRLLIAQREVIRKLARDPYPPIDEADRVYFRDLYDHMVRLQGHTETLRDLVSTAVDSYLSSVANRTNEVMKAMTVVTVLFLPLNFVAGFFGMNFFGEAIELHGLGVPKSALFAGTCLFLVAAPLALAYWMKRRGWF